MHIQDYRGFVSVVTVDKQFFVVVVVVFFLSHAADNLKKALFS